MSTSYQTLYQPQQRTNMATRQQQLIENIVAMEEQGAPQEDIQAYLNSLGAVAPERAETPGGAAFGAFERAADDINLAQDLLQERGGPGQGFTDPGVTAFLAGGLAPGEAAFGALSATETGQNVTYDIVNGLTKMGMFLTGGDTKAGQKIRESIGGKVEDVLEGYDYMPPEEQLKQRNKLRFAEVLSFGIGKAVEDILTAGIKKAGPRVSGVKAKYVPNPAKTAEEAVDKGVTRMHKAFERDNPTVGDALEGQSTSIAKNEPLRSLFTDKDFVDSSDLYAALLREGGFPGVVGKSANLDNFIRETSNRMTKLASSQDTLLGTNPALTPLLDLKLDARTILANSPQVDTHLPQAMRQLDSYFDGIASKPRYASGNADAVSLNQLRRNMNAQTKAFAKDDGFTQDVADAIGDAIRKRLDEIEPKVGTANLEYSRLANIRRTAVTLNRQPIKVNEYIEALGRLTGVSFLGSIGAGFALGGPGGLVIAGVFATVGGNKMADILRKGLIKGRERKLIIEAFKNNPDYAQELINSASKANAAYLARTLLPEPSQTSIPLRPRSVNETPRIEPAATQTGQVPKGQTIKGKYGDAKGKTFKGGQMFKGWKSVTQASDDAAKAQAAAGIRARIEFSIKQGEDLNQIAAELASREGVPLREAQNAVIQIANEVGPI